jgi:hypothetical protein
MGFEPVDHHDADPDNMKPLRQSPEAWKVHAATYVAQSKQMQRVASTCAA